MLERAPAFFDFVKEREAIRLRKEADSSFLVDGKKQWTQDPILANYKFTNVRRHHDRTSRELRERFYNKHFNDDKASLLMNAATFRYFGTWEFADYLGWMDFEDMTHEWWEEVKAYAHQRLSAKQRVFTGAYVITNQGISAPKYEVVVDHFLKSLQAAIPEVMEVLEVTNKWENVATRMRNIQGFGGSGFMTKEVLLDTTYAGFWENDRDHPEDGKFSFPDDWWSWTPIGPGARRGAARVKGDENALPLGEKEAFRVIETLGLYQDSLDMLPVKGALAPHDIQFQLCEFDKYERVRLGQGKPRSRYAAI